MMYNVSNVVLCAEVEEVVIIIFSCQYSLVYGFGFTVAL